jgi:DNA (cytosine-5)-methyltransferase 1
MFFEFARCVKEVEPTLFLAENVEGLIRHAKGRHEFRVPIVSIHGM